MFQIVENIAIEQHPRICFLGVSETPMVCCRTMAMDLNETPVERFPCTVIFIESDALLQLVRPRAYKE